ncbi:pitrilysin family protein [uncultured Muribaculum sp.]|uniref:M16 family metallopeptidase n=1 Tax=uncultured Muribaculum sp. TaxID=1918613 RepID=UPI0025AF545A|nr:pitrilysin family protein [uncultured Muribaculum sp.]
MIEASVFTLENGLRVIHHRDEATAMVALNVLYNVGARDEDAAHTGMAHLFEHLMFGGSVHIPDFDKALEHAGGTNNAWTNADYTNFYDIVPAHNVETAFWLESDRMEALAFTPKSLEVQKDVVCEEFKQVCLNQPYGDLMHHLDALAYTVHPYRTPVIGAELSHIQSVTLNDVREFFYSHYAPNNAVLAVTGNISLERTRELAGKWFGPICRRNILSRNYQPEPEQTAPRCVTVEGRVPQTMIVKAYHMPGIDHPLYPAADIITDILASGRASRFYQNLVLASDLFTQADASVTGTDEPGLLMTRGLLCPDTDVDSALEMLTTQAESIIANPPGKYELERALNKFESTTIFGNIGFANLASNLAHAEMHNTTIGEQLERYRCLSVDDIVDAARLIIRENNSSTVIYRPMGQ